MWRRRRIVGRAAAHKNRGRELSAPQYKDVVYQEERPEGQKLMVVEPLAVETGGAMSRTLGFSLA